MKVDNIKPEKIVLSSPLVTVHKTMSTSCRRSSIKKWRNCTFLALFSSRAGVRDDSGMSHLMRAQLRFYVQGYPGTPEVAALAVTSGTSRIRARPPGDFRTSPKCGCGKQGRLLKQRHRSRKRRRRKYDYATSNLSSLHIFDNFELWSIVWTSLHSVSRFLVNPRPLLERQIVMCHLSLLVSARVLDDFRRISRFVIFNVTRAVLETLHRHVHLVALLSQRARVKSRLTQQRFVLWLRRLHELANPWKRFKSLVIF